MIQKRALVAVLIGAAAIVLSAGVMFVAAAGMTLRGVSAADIYDLLGSLSVCGFLTAYALVTYTLALRWFRWQ